MLDKRILELARKTATAQLRDLDNPLALAAGANRAKLHGYGHLYLILMQLYEQEVGRRAQIIWRNLHRAHGSFGASISPELRSDLVDAFRVDLDAMLADLCPRFEADMKDAPKSAKGPDWLTKLTAARDKELERYEAEIEHYVASLEAAAARGAPAMASYVIHGNVGALVSARHGAFRSSAWHTGLRYTIRKSLLFLLCNACSFYGVRIERVCLCDVLFEVVWASMCDLYG